MPDLNWFGSLTEDETDPSTPLFWETVHWFATQGQHLTRPDTAKPDTTWEVKAQEMSREIAIRTPTQMLPVVSDGQG